MSRNAKYTEQFDRAAGAPAEFDNLFSINGEELSVNRRIKMKKGGRRTAAMVSAAAAITLTAAVGLNMLSSSGQSSDISVAERAIVSEVGAEDNSGETVYLSSLLDRFECVTHYYPSEELVAPKTLSVSDTSAIAKARVVSKKYSDDGSAEYELQLLFSFENAQSINEAVFDSDSPSIFLKYDGTELHIGSEYILPLNIKSSDGGYYCSVADKYAFPIRKTEKGWLMSENEPVANGGVKVECDIENYYPYSPLVLVNISDNEMLQRIVRLYESEYPQYTGIVHEDADADEKHYLPSDFFRFFSTEFFESIRFDKNKDGSEDHTVLVLENQVYFELIPGISGTVLYTGENMFGETVVAIKPDSEDCSAVIFSGLESISVSQGDRTDSSTLIGICGAEPVYCRFYDSEGLAISFGSIS